MLSCSGTENALWASSRSFLRRRKKAAGSVVWRGGAVVEEKSHRKWRYHYVYHKKAITLTIACSGPSSNSFPHELYLTTMHHIVPLQQWLCLWLTMAHVLLEVFPDWYISWLISSYNCNVPVMSGLFWTLTKTDVRPYISEDVARSYSYPRIVETIFRVLCR